MELDSSLIHCCTASAAQLEPDPSICSCPLAAPAGAAVISVMMLAKAIAAPARVARAQAPC
jgi:hypothetical protein